MRISDWSSDVCSSDLLDSGPPWSCRGVVRGFAPNSQPVDKIHPLWISDGAESARRGMNRACRIHARAFAKLIHRGSSSPPTRAIIADPKSVVEGKGLSDCVGLGGRRIIKKTTRT